METLVKYLKPTIYWAVVSAATLFVVLILIGTPKDTVITLSITRMFFALIGTQFVLTAVLIFLNR